MQLTHALTGLNRRFAAVVREWRLALGPSKLALQAAYEIAADKYHQWYYGEAVHESVRFLGLPVWKSVSDLWNYQEILSELRPALVVEFGTLYGGSALYFATILGTIRPDFRVVTVDTVAKPGRPTHPSIEYMDGMSINSGPRIAQLRAEFPGPAFFILDSDHSADNVYAELAMLRDLTRPGDYVIVEDSNINGHPVFPGWGAGPFEAIERYFSNFPNDYTRDVARESKFGFTYAPNGFLIRR